MTAQLNFLRLLGDSVNIDKLEQILTNNSPAVYTVINEESMVSESDSDTDSSSSSGSSVEVTGEYKSLPRSKPAKKDTKKALREPLQIPRRFRFDTCLEMTATEKNILHQRAYLNILRILYDIDQTKDCDYIVCRAIDAYMHSVCVQIEADFDMVFAPERDNAWPMVRFILQIFEADSSHVRDILAKENESIVSLNSDFMQTVDENGEALTNINRVENLGMYPGYVWKMAHRILFMQTLHSKLQNYYNQEEVVQYEVDNIRMDYISNSRNESDILVLVSYDFLSRKTYPVFEKTNALTIQHDDTSAPNVCVALDSQYLTANIISLTRIGVKQPVVLFRNSRRHPYAYQNGYYCVSTVPDEKKKWLAFECKFPKNNSENDYSSKNNVTIGEMLMTHAFMTSDNMLAMENPVSRALFVEQIQPRNSSKKQHPPQKIQFTAVGMYLSSFPENNFFAYRRLLSSVHYPGPHWAEDFYLPHPRRKTPNAQPNIRYNGILSSLLLYQLNDDDAASPKSIKQLAPCAFLSENILYNYINTAHELWYPKGTIVIREFAHFVANIDKMDKVLSTVIRQKVITTDKRLDFQIQMMINEMAANDKKGYASYFGVIINQGNMHWAFGLFVVTRVNGESKANFYVFDSLVPDKNVCRNYQLLMIEFVLKYRIGWSVDDRRKYENTEKNREIVYVDNVPKQSNKSNNCGLFTALFAVAFKCALTKDELRSVDSLIDFVHSNIESEKPLAVRKNTDDKDKKMIPEKLREELYKFARANIAPPRSEDISMINEETSGKSKIPPKRAIKHKTSRATVTIDESSVDDDDDGETLYTQEQRDRRAESLLRAEIHQAKYREMLYAKKFKAMLERAEKETDPDKKASLLATYQYNIRKKQLRDEYYTLFYSVPKTPEERVTRKNKLKENALLDHHLELRRENMQLLEGELTLLAHAKDSKEHALVSESLAARRASIKKLEAKTNTVGKEFDSDEDDDDDDDDSIKPAKAATTEIKKTIVIDIDDDDDDDDESAAVVEYKKFINKE